MGTTHEQHGCEPHPALSQGKGPRESPLNTSLPPAEGAVQGQVRLPSVSGAKSQFGGHEATLALTGAAGGTPHLEGKPLPQTLGKGGWGGWGTARAGPLLAGPRACRSTSPHLHFLL